MDIQTKIDINIDQEFQHLEKAPIVEAVIAINAWPKNQFDEKFVRDHLEGKMEGYNFMDSLHEFRQEIKFGGGAEKPSNQGVQDLGWKGLRFRSTDERNIVQINRDGFVFSRLQPYESWQQLSSEANRLWNIYKDLANPFEINRVGLRFINRFQLPPFELNFEDYINPAPATPRGLDLPFLNFLHQDRLAVPGHDYTINVIRAIQQPSDRDKGCIGIIIDIDVYTLTKFELNEGIIERRLIEMRWLKNMVFFGSITSKALEGFR